MARTIAKDHDEKRIAKRIAAARIFAVQGVDRASKSTIAKACGVSKALIYGHYAEKSKLLFDILTCHLDGLNEVVDAVPRGAARNCCMALQYCTRAALGPWCLWL